MMGTAGSFIRSAAFVTLTTAALLGWSAQSNAQTPEWPIADQAALAVLLKGNTSVEAGGSWAVHYAMDGRKIIAVSGRDTVERKWWVNDKGEWCETLYKDSAESCAPEIHVTGSKGRIIGQHNNLKWEFDVLPGNPNNL